jgi:hypothetical protein
MPKYRVVWESEIDADNLRQAAAIGYQVQKGQQVWGATFAGVSEDGERHDVDLEQPDLDQLDAVRASQRAGYLGHG